MLIARSYQRTAWLHIRAGAHMRIHSTLRERVYTGAFIARKVQWFTVNRSRNIPVASMERWKQMMTDELTGTLQRYQKDLPLVALGEGPSPLPQQELKILEQSINVYSI